MCYKYFLLITLLTRLLRLSTLDSKQSIYEGDNLTKKLTKYTINIISNFKETWTYQDWHNMTSNLQIKL